MSTWNAETYWRLSSLTEAHTLVYKTQNEAINRFESKYPNAYYVWVDPADVDKGRLCFENRMESFYVERAIALLEEVPYPTHMSLKMKETIEAKRLRLARKAARNWQRGVHLRDNGQAASLKRLSKLTKAERRSSR